MVCFVLDMKNNINMFIAPFYAQGLHYLLKEVEKHVFFSKWLDHLLLMKSYQELPGHI